MLQPFSPELYSKNVAWSEYEMKDKALSFPHWVSVPLGPSQCKHLTMLPGILMLEDNAFGTTWPVTSPVLNSLV